MLKLLGVRIEAAGDEGDIARRPEDMPAAVRDHWMPISCEDIAPPPGLEAEDTRWAAPRDHSGIEPPAQKDLHEVLRRARRTAHCLDGIRYAM